MSPVHVALVEVAPTPECVMVSGPAAGGFARCYVGAASEDLAVTAITQALVEKGFRVGAVEWCVREDEAEWEQPDDAEAERCVQEARASGEVVIGRIDTWEDE